MERDGYEYLHRYMTRFLTLSIKLKKRIALGDTLNVFLDIAHAHSATTLRSYKSI